MTSPIVLFATGHRPNKLGGYGEIAQTRLIVLARHHLADIKPTRVLSGMAVGWDQAVAQAARDLRIPYIACIPFEGQEKMWPTPSQERFDLLCSKAEKIIIVCPGGYTASKMQTRNEYMVDNATHGLSLWNGDTSGGTFNCIRYARQLKRPMRNAWPQFLSLMET